MLDIDGRRCTWKIMEKSVVVGSAQVFCVFFGPEWHGDAACMREIAAKDVTKFDAWGLQSVSSKYVENVGQRRRQTRLACGSFRPRARNFYFIYVVDKAGRQLLTGGSTCSTYAAMRQYSTPSQLRAGIVTRHVARSSVVVWR